MKRKYTILAVLLVIFGLGLVILPGKSDKEEVNPRMLLSAIAQKSRYLSVDQVTHRIIEKDPTLLLVDLRPSEQFKTFALPGATNIQPDSLLTRTTIDLFSQPGKDKILYSNSDLIPEKAWLLCSRYSLNRIYIMKGGMNEWYSTIIKGEEITGTPSSGDLDLLSFRKAARQIFTGSGITENNKSVPAGKEKVQVVRKAPKAGSGGGC
jgi:sulfur-carrier protein adenylyltransferase/sulfurtransferase